MKFPSMFHDDFIAGRLRIDPIKLQFTKDMNNVTPTVSKLRPLSHVEHEVLRAWWDSALSQGIIQPSNSVWRSTIFPVKKPVEIDAAGKVKKKWRIVTPFFGLNSLLNLRASSLPTLVDIKRVVAGATLYSVADLTQAFFQLPVHKDSRPYLAIGARGFPLAQYTALPMGLSISTSILQSELIKILHKYYFVNVIIYADDILIFTKDKNEKEHIALVEEILALLNRVNIKISPKKLQLCKKSVDFLGMVLTTDGWRVQDKFLDSIRRAKVPQSVKELRSFLGIATWQKPFVQEFSRIAAPLYGLLSKENINRGVKKAWNKETQEAFEALKSNLLTSTTLDHPKFDQEFFMCSDASKDAIGALLYQKVENKKRVIGYFSRKLSKTETIKGIPEKKKC